MADGLKEIRDYIGELAETAGSTGRSLILAAAIAAFRYGLNRDIVMAFATRTSPDGDPWPPRKDKKPHPLLILSGDMYEAAVNSVQGGTQTENGIVIPLEGPEYRLIHQLGSGRVPKRQFFGITDKTNDDVIQAIESTATTVKEQYLSTLNKLG